MKFATSAGASERYHLREVADTDLRRKLPLPGVQLVEVEPGQSVGQAAAEFEASGVVEYAEPNYYRYVTAVPNDPYFPFQWGMYNTGQSGGTPDADIDATEAWQTTIGSPTVPVAIIDTGVDYTHPDLAPNTWTNPGEAGSGRESNQLDDDRDGLVDDWFGWDFADNDNTPSDPHGHGTHLASTVGARGNDGTGVAGVGWTTRLMLLRAFDQDGSGTVADFAAAVRYAAAHGAKVVNASVGASFSSRTDRDAIRAAPDVLFVASARNGGPDRLGDDNDTTPEYPCAYRLANIVCVTASDRNDALASFADYGDSTVDLAAPGVAVLGDRPGNRYIYKDGASMATSQVAGAAGLLRASDPRASVLAVRRALLRGVDRKPAFSGKTTTGGRLNVAGALSVMRRMPPRLTVKVRKRQALRSALVRGIRVRLGWSESCRLTSQLVLDGRTARQLRVSRRRVIVAKISRRFSGPGTANVRLKLKRSTRRKLSRARRVRIRLKVAAADPAGNSRATSRWIRLIR